MTTDNFYKALVFKKLFINKRFPVSEFVPRTTQYQDAHRIASVNRVTNL